MSTHTNSAVNPLLLRYKDPTVENLERVLDTAKRTKADPEVIQGIETILHHIDLREDYTLRMTSQDSHVCRKVFEDTLRAERSRGQFLKSMLSAQGARRVLDVGMYTGYSALSMAEALPADGELVTLDREPYLKERNQAVFDSVPQVKKISIRIGDSLDIMREMLKDGEKFDFIFLDADKSEYLDYVKLCFEGLLAENGTVAVDNAYWLSHNYLPASNQPPDAIRSFGEQVAKDGRLHKVLVPIRDGVFLLRPITEVERDLTH